MDGRLHLAAVRRIAALGRRIVGAAQLDHLAGGVLLHFLAGDEIGVAQAHFGARRQPEEFLRRILHEIFLLDIDLAAEADLARAGGRIVGMIDRFELFALPFRIILDHHL